jgi:hypothetical protein
MGNLEQAGPNLRQIAGITDVVINFMHGRIYYDLIFNLWHLKFLYRIPGGRNTFRFYMVIIVSIMMRKEKNE